MSIEQTLAERGNRYGDFADHARLCQDLKSLMQNFAPASWTTSAPWHHLSDVQKQALEVIADKIARILSGDPNYADNWHDIQGYAKLVEDRLPTVKQSLTVEPASLIDDESPRMQAIAQNGNDGAAYSEIDRLRAAEAFNADLPVTIEEAIALGAVPRREPCQPRHRCLACGLGHATHECQPAT